MARTTRIPSLAALPTHDDDDNVVGVIETPKGARTKLAFDPELGAFIVKKVLPEGMSFPLCFGFIPSTLGEDGDPLDVLVLMDEAVPTGTIVPLRLVGVIEAVQTETDGEAERNDRLLAVACSCQMFVDVKKISDVPKLVLKEIERFFVNMNDAEGKTFALKGCHGRKRAESLLESGARRHRRKKK